MPGVCVWVAGGLGCRVRGLPGALVAGGVGCRGRGKAWVAGGEGRRGVRFAAGVGG